MARCGPVIGLQQPLAIRVGELQQLNHKPAAVLKADLNALAVLAAIRWNDPCGIALVC
jgi:hypothetical protein